MVTNNKQRLSVSLSMETVKLINKSLKLEKFRNKSHVVEFSLNKVLKNKQNSDQEIKENA
jgi:Arc/MetJ-type ribon-helix-helix transcriptional regulator